MKKKLWGAGAGALLMLGAVSRVQRVRPGPAGGRNPEELALLPEEELARVVPRHLLEGYGSRLLAEMSSDELAHVIPTGAWRKLRRTPVLIRRLFLLTPDGQERRIPAFRRGARLRAGPRAGRAPGPWVIVLAPHPDDETYGIGGLTHHLYREGWKVALVLCTRGEAASYYRHGRARGWWRSREEFGRYRVREWCAATDRIAPGALRFRYGCGDRDLTAAEAAAIVEAVDAYVGGASLIMGTLGLPWEYHPDHHALAEGLRRARAPRAVKQWYFVYSDSPLVPPGAVAFVLSPEDRAAKNAALQEYRERSPYHGIGYHTSPRIWEREYDDSREYYTGSPWKSACETPVPSVRNYATTSTRRNRTVSTSPRLVTRSSGSTGNARRDMVMKGDPN